MRREGSHAPCKRQRPFGFDARTCTRTLAITYAHPHAQAQSITDTRSHARTRSYYLPVVNDTSQRTPTVLYAHGSCVRQGALSGSMRCRHRQVLLSEWRTPPFAAGRPRLDTTSPAALHRHLCTGPLCTQRTRRGSLHAGLVYLNVSHLPQASPCQSLPCTGVRALRGRNDIARLVSRSTRARTHRRVCRMG